MKSKMHLLLALALSVAAALAEQPDTIAPPRRLTLHEAVQLGLQHNHVVRINDFKVEEKQYAKSSGEE